MAETRAKRIEAAARKLLAAMDRQWGGRPFSVNVQLARVGLRALLPEPRDEDDEAPPPAPERP